MYHGTKTQKGRRILKNQKMKYSRGDGEWLGDGIYLYKDRIYAYRWITIQYKNKHSGDPVLKDLLEEYMILDVEVFYDYERTFSLLNPEHRMEFLKAKEACKRKAGFSERLRAYNYTDGVILNIMFKNMGYSRDYDMVEAVFPLENEEETDSRFGSLSEYQLCVKNPDRIGCIKDGTSEFPFGEYRKKLHVVNSYRTKCNIKKGIYKT